MTGAGTGIDDIPPATLARPTKGNQMCESSWSGVVYRHLVESDDTPATVTVWLQTESDPVKRVSLFAVALAEDYIAAFRRADGVPHADLQNSLMRMALDRVNWHRVARALIRYFGTPVTMANLALNAECPPRLVRAMATMHPALN